MKKLLSIFLVVFAFVFVACSNSKDITYSEKFTYLPIISEAELISFQEGEGEAPDKAEYKLVKTTVEKASSDYKDLLTKNGWQFSETESEGDTYKFTKDDHWAVIIFDESGEDAKFTIISN